MSKVKRLVQLLGDKYGKDVITLGSELDIRSERVSTGVPDLDKILGGGIPVSTIAEIYGPDSVGKTTLAYRFISQAQKHGEVVYVDLEGQWDRKWAKVQGVDVSSVILVRPVAAEGAVDAIIEAVRRGCSAVVLDSIAAMEPLQAFKRRIDEPLVGQVPLLLNRAIRRILIYQKDSKTIVMLLNQVRERVSVGRPIYGDPITTPGGRGVRHFSHLRLNMDRIRYLTKEKNKIRKRIGHVVGIVVVKSKVSMPHERCEVKFEYGRGFVG